MVFNISYWLDIEENMGIQLDSISHIYRLEGWPQAVMNMVMNMLKSSWAVSRITVVSKKLSELCVFIIRVSVMNDLASLVYIYISLIKLMP